MAEYEGVMVYCEVANNKLKAIATEILGCGRRLSNELGEELCAVIIGSGVSGLTQEAIASGADRVYVIDSPLFRDYRTDSYVLAMEKVAKEAKPQIILFGQTSSGRDLGPRLAFRLDTAATLGCVDLTIDPNSKRLLQTKPVYGGNALALFTCETNPQVATVLAKTMPPLERDTKRKGDVITIEVGVHASAIRTTVLERIKEEVQGINLEDASVIVAGGRGIGGVEGFKELEELAKTLKGAIGATRPACDNGWVSAGLQIGLSGKIVSPDLYIAVALSGSSQHMGGCSGAKNIVAINKDPVANIFRKAHFGAVGDWKRILPAFTQKITELLAD